MRILEGRISLAIVPDPKNHQTDIVAFGVEVDVMTKGKTRRTFRIVGEDEADPAQGLIAPYSPLGVALLGAELCSIVEWRKPAGTIDLEIVAIQFPLKTPAG